MNFPEFRFLTMTIVLLCVLSCLLSSQTTNCDKSYQYLPKEIYEFEKHRVLSDDAVAIRSIFEKLKKSPHSLKLQKEYLKYFPKNFKDFDRIFGYNESTQNYLNAAGELYYGPGYILILESFSSSYFSDICKISLDIAKYSSPLEVDRYYELKLLIADMLFRNQIIFKKQLFLLPPSERFAALSFAIKEIYGREEYKKLLSALKTQNDREFSSLLKEVVLWGTNYKLDCNCHTLLPSEAFNFTTAILEDTTIEVPTPRRDR